MPKWLMFALFAAVDFAVAVLLYLDGRVILPLILVMAGACFVIASVGKAREKT